MRAFVNVCKRKETRDTRFPFRARFRFSDAVRAVYAANKTALARREMRNALVHASAHFKHMNAVEAV